MTKDEIEKLAQAYAGQHETRCKENQFHLAISFMELRAAFIAGYLKGVEAEKLNYKNSIEHEMAVVRTEYLKVITALVDDSSKLEKQLAIAKEALDKNVKTIGNFMDRLSVEGIGNPDISTARLGTIEALHCFKRSRSALEQIERGDK